MSHVVSQRKKELNSLRQKTSARNLMQLVRSKNSHCISRHLQTMKIQLATEMNKLIQPVPEAPMIIRECAQVGCFNTSRVHPEILNRWLEDHDLLIENSDIRKGLLALARIHFTARNYLIMIQLLCDSHCHNVPDRRNSEKATRSTQSPHLPMRAEEWLRNLFLKASTAPMTHSSEVERE